jgi:hypothetical protein
MNVKVKFIKPLGVNKVGDEIIVHQNMKAHLVAKGYVEGENLVKPEKHIELSEEKPIVLKTVEPLKIQEPEVVPEKPKAKPKVERKRKTATKK